MYVLLPYHLATLLLLDWTVGRVKFTGRHRNTPNPNPVSVGKLLIQKSLICSDENLLS